MIFELCKIDRNAGLSDDVGVIRNGEEVGRTGNRTSVPGPEGMRHLCRVYDDFSGQAVATFINGVNQAHVCEVRGHELYVCARGTGTEDVRKKLELFIDALSRLDRHSKELQQQILPYLSPKQQDEYSLNPTGKNLWEVTVGDNPYNLQLPSQLMPTVNTPAMAEFRNQMFRFEMGEPTGEVVTNGQLLYHHDDFGNVTASISDPACEGMRPMNLMIYGDMEMWAERLVNFLNEMNGANVFHLAKPTTADILFDNVDIYVDPRVRIPEEQFKLITGALFYDNITELSNSPEFKQFEQASFGDWRSALRSPVDGPTKPIHDAYNHICLRGFNEAPTLNRNDVWTLMTGTDPRAYDDPTIEHSQSRNEQLSQDDIEIDDD